MSEKAEFDEAKALRFVLSAIRQVYPGPKGREYEAWVECLAASAVPAGPDASEARCRTLEAALRRYGQHDHSCPVTWNRDHDCTCGFGSLLPTPEADHA